MAASTSVVLAGGGSAGHVSPLLATADALRRREPELRVTVLGTSTGLEAELVPARGYDLRFVPKVPMPRRPGKALMRLPGALRTAVTAARAVIDEVDADVVVGFGGYVSSPAYLAARSAMVPIVIHEQNARAGMANRLGARFTRHVATTFRQTELAHACCIGMPLRREIAELDPARRAALRAEALTVFGLDDRRPTIVVTGGSLGAQRLNDTLRGCAEDLSAAGVQVLHLTGKGKSFDPPPVAGPRYVVRDYAERMELAYAVADLLVCRAGANTVCEVSAVGLAAVYVPLPIGNGEQRLNAHDVISVGGGLLVDDADFTTRWVRDHLLPLVSDRARLAIMARAAEGAGQRGADDVLADMVLRAAR